MPYPLSPEAEAKIAAGRMVSAYLVDFYCADEAGDALTLRAWDWPGPLNYPAADALSGEDLVAYTGMHGRLRIDRTVRFTVGLATEPARITLDGSRAGDDDDFVGQFTDARWHQRVVRCRQVLLDFESGTSPTTPVWSWRGRLDYRQFTRIAGQEMPLVITCQGGTFRVRDRRMHTRTDADQRRRKSTDTFFAGVPQMIACPIIWAKKSTYISNGANSPGNWADPGGGGSRNSEVY